MTGKFETEIDYLHWVLHEYRIDPPLSFIQTSKSNGGDNIKIIDVKKLKSVLNKLKQLGTDIRPYTYYISEILDMYIIKLEIKLLPIFNRDMKIDESLEITRKMREEYK